MPSKPTLDLLHPDFITVNAQKSARIEATLADFFITVSGSSLVSGSVALKKAREVAEVVNALGSIDIDEKQIHIDSIHVENQSGTFTKTSSAYYSLRVESVPLERVAEAIGTIANSRNAKLKYIQWRFPNEVALRDTLRQECLQTALERGRYIAATLGVKLLGIYEMEELWSGAQEEKTSQYIGQGEMKSRARRIHVTEAELGMAVSHAETVELEIRFKFRVSEFGEV